MTTIHKKVVETRVLKGNTLPELNTQLHELQKNNDLASNSSGLWEPHGVVTFAAKSISYEYLLVVNRVKIVTYD